MWQFFFRGKQNEDGKQAIVFQATAIQAIEIGRRRQTGGTGHLEQTDRDRVTKTDGQRHVEKDIQLNQDFFPKLFDIINMSSSGNLHKYTKY